MEKKWILILSIGFFGIVVFGGYFAYNWIYSEEGLPRFTPVDEMTFKESYFQGNMCWITCDGNGENCHTVTTKEECENIDVVVEGEYSQWGQDGKPDCEWIENVVRYANGTYGPGCRPNKQ